MYLGLLLLMQAGDCELNPGPQAQDGNSCSKFPCLICNDPCTWDQNAIQCDECDGWYHTQCMGMNTLNYEALGHSNISWTCCHCGIPNFSTSLFSQLSLETSNSFSHLSSTCTGDDDLPLSPPAATSSPKGPSTSKFTKQTKQKQKPMPKRQVKVMVVNFQSIKNKTAELADCLDIHDPDIILGSETWLNNTVEDKEIIPDNYTVFRKDREDSHGGVVIAIRNDMVCAHRPDLNTNCEIVWAQVQLVGSKTLTIGSFYRPPDKNDVKYLQELHESISKIKNPNSGIIWLGGDFNLGNIDWPTQSVLPGPNPKSVCYQMIDIMNNFNLDQIVIEPTRNDSILELFFTSNATLVEKSILIPGISDHQGIPVITLNLTPKTCNRSMRKVYMYHKGDVDGMKREMKNLSTGFVDKYSNMEDICIDTLWNQFKQNLSVTVDKFIPSKIVSGQKKAPWISNKVKRYHKRKQRAYNKARKSNNESDWDSFKEIRKDTHRLTRATQRSYIRNFCLDSKKQFWSFVRNLRSDTTGIQP
ncbi:uncharacterized protein [Amphiura filiformis]|uniref:uncharacterized protein n=1 Tax=Amphiura filiformis TaxID=82378 RepID=UPI003B2236AE